MAASSSAAADFVLEINMRGFGIDARSNQATYLFTHAEAVLIDRRTGREVWSEDVRGTDRLTPHVRGTRDVPSSIIAAGITTWIAYEVIINIGVMVAALPFAGNALPFISYGGSSLVVTLAAVGLLLSISRHDPDSSIPRKTRAAFDYSRWDRRPRVSSTRRRE